MPNYKFSDFTDGGNLASGDIVVGLQNGMNARFSVSGGLPTSLPVPISEGGTGATTAAQARVNLNVPSLAQVLTTQTVTVASTVLQPFVSYTINFNSGLVTLTLPLASVAGDVIEITGWGTGGWVIAQNASQMIRIGDKVSTTGVGGSVASTNRYDALRIKQLSNAGTIWVAQSAIGNLTVT